MPYVHPGGLVLAEIPERRARTKRNHTVRRPSQAERPAYTHINKRGESWLKFERKRGNTRNDGALKLLTCILSVEHSFK